jgi:hypothetical protein
VSERVDVAIVGAGPFGLSLASFFGGARRARVFGAPMKTWRTQMPEDMLMRSAWEETSLASPGGRGSIDAWAAATGAGRQEPIPLQAFLRYADWFRERFVGDHDAADVVSVARSGDGFRVATSGDEIEARAVVLAVGVTPFPYAPPQLADAVGDGVTFAIEQQRSFDHLRGKRVVVVGAGQAGLESAGLAARAGADVEVLARSGVRWFADREPHNPRGPVAQRLYRLAYPAVGYGPPPLNRLVLYPDLFAALPRDARRRLTERLLRPGGSPWVRGLVEGKVRITEGRRVSKLARADGVLRLGLDDGSTREADAVLLATGYRFALDRLGFLDRALRAEVALDGGFPKLDRFFRSTARGLFFVGYPAEGRFGPLSRFVLGTEFTSPRVRRAFG